MKEIKFLHVSDLHIGDKSNEGLLAQVINVLFDDIKYILSKIGTLDVVFFTGDLVQKGTKEEFQLLEVFLEKLWKLFKNHGQNPYLLCVPGNHDLERVDVPNHPIQKVMLNWLNDDIKDDCFWKSPNPYHDFVIERFKNFIEWHENTAIKKPEIKRGYIPGDFFCSLIVNNIKLGVVGLNSSFLQLYGGDLKEKLGIYNKQIHLLFNDNYFEWIKSHHLSVLLTHHSPEWYEPISKAEYSQGIYANDCYVEHLCGHMHEPKYTATSINGFPSKRIFVCPSLFGLKHYGHNNKRIHGYNAGIYKMHDSGIFSKTIWPRISFFTQSGIFKISPNEEFNLEKDSPSFSENLHNSKKINGTDDGFGEGSSTIKNIEEKSGNLFSNKLVQSKLFARSQYRELSTHMNIRFQARKDAVNQLKSKHFTWIVTKFGLGEEEFVGSILNDSNINPGNCFCVKCDEVTSTEGLILAFNKTFSQNITQFFDIINSLDNPLVVLDRLTDELINDSSSLNEFMQTIIDFSPNSKIILISETAPDEQYFEYTELFPLDVPGVKQFIEQSQEIQSTFTFLEYEKIHRITSGIPFYINKVIEQLTFRPLADIGDMEFIKSSNDDTDLILPKNIVNEIDHLRLDDSKQGNRRLFLLKVLSLLHNGETYERIKRFDQILPFYPEDISYLLKNKLIETLQVNSIFDNKVADNELVKIIRVSRIVRDYISSLIDEDEKAEIYKKSCSLYLGENWRNSIKIIQTKDAELELIIHQNIQIALRFLLSFNIDKKNEVEVSRMVRTCLSIIKYFSKRGAYKDAVSLAEEILILIKDVSFDGFERFRTYLLKGLGQNLRMTSIHDRSIAILKSICDDEENSLTQIDRNEIRLSIAYAYETKKNKEQAVKYANLIKAKEKNKNSSLYLSAEAVIAHFVEDASDKMKRLTAIKNKCEKLNYSILKANVTFAICKISKKDSQLKQLDKIVAESQNDIYNKVRALIIKADIVLSNKNIQDITYEDLMGLNVSYTYSFYQRLMQLLNQCHKLAWQYWIKQNRFDQLLILFRYSSFLWRLCGAVDLEKKYIDELYSNSKFIKWFSANKNGLNSKYYEQRIFGLYNNRVN